MLDLLRNKERTASTDAARVSIGPSQRQLSYLDADIDVVTLQQLCGVPEELVVQDLDVWAGVTALLGLIDTLLSPLTKLELLGQCRKMIGEATINGATAALCTRSDADKSARAIFTVLLILSKFEHPHSATTVISLLFPQATSAMSTMNKISGTAPAALELDPDTKWCLSAMQGSLRFVIVDLLQELDAKYK